MKNVIIDSPNGDKCVLVQNLSKFFTALEIEDFNKWIVGKECIGIPKDGEIDVAIPMKLINQFISQT